MTRMMKLDMTLKTCTKLLTVDISGSHLCDGQDLIVSAKQNKNLSYDTVNISCICCFRIPFYIISWDIYLHIILEFYIFSAKLTKLVSIYLVLCDNTFNSQALLIRQNRNSTTLI